MEGASRTWTFKEESVTKLPVSKYLSSVACMMLCRANDIETTYARLPASMQSGVCFEEAPDDALQVGMSLISLCYKMDWTAK